MGEGQFSSDAQRSHFGGWPYFSITAPMLSAVMIQFIVFQLALQMVGFPASLVEGCPVLSFSPWRAVRYVPKQSHSAPPSAPAACSSSPERTRSAFSYAAVCSGSSENQLLIFGSTALAARSPASIRSSALSNDFHAMCCTSGVITRFDWRRHCDSVRAVMI